MKEAFSPEELSLRLQQGDLHALELLYQEFQDELFFYALKLTNDRPMAEDAVQDTFVSFWKYREKIGSIKSFKFYLLRSVRHRCLKLLANKRRFGVLSLAGAKIEMRIEPAEMRLTDYSQVVKKKVEQALGALSIRQREIIYLKYYENLTYQEIAELLSINYQSVVNHVHRAIQKLRQADILQYLEY